MKTNEFDSALKAKFEENSFEYNPAQWERLSKQLEHTETKRGGGKIIFLTAMGLAASLALFAAAYTFFIKADAPETQIAATNKAATKNTPAITTAKQTEPAIQQQQNTPTIVAANNKPVAHKTKQNNIAATHTPIKIQPTHTIVPQANVKEATNIATADNSIKTEKKLKEPFVQQNMFNEDYTTMAAVNNNNKTIISVNGGYNYGSLGNGYAVGASAHHNLSSRLYVEADVAFVGNGNSANKTVYNTTFKRIEPAPNTGVGMPQVSGDRFESETIKEKQQKNYNLYYLQLTPVMGYKVHKRISVGVGPDLQRLLYDNKPGDVDAASYSEIPNLDLGVMAKTELSITNKLKAAISYREALNNTFGGKNKYVDRSYMQVQLKFALNKAK